MVAWRNCPRLFSLHAGVIGWFGRQEDNNNNNDNDNDNDNRDDNRMERPRDENKHRRRVDYPMPLMM
jgi:hypothetical protein